jgi:hypothetical protein
VGPRTGDVIVGKSYTGTAVIVGKV